MLVVYMGSKKYNKKISKVTSFKSVILGWNLVKQSLFTYCTSNTGRRPPTLPQDRRLEAHPNRPNADHARQSSDLPFPHQEQLLQTPVCHTPLSTANRHIIPSYRQRKLLPLQNLRVVNPEEVRVQHRLHDPSEHANRFPVALRKIPVDPIRDIQRTVAA